MSEAGDDDVVVSDADRERVVSLLVGALGNGDLQLGESSDRAAQAYSGDTKDQLDRLSADLPQNTSAGGPHREAAERTRWLVPPIGGLVRRGRWRLPRRLVFIAGWAASTWTYGKPNYPRRRPR